MINTVSVLGLGLSGTHLLGSLGFNLKTEKKKWQPPPSNPTTINKYLKLKLLNWIDNKLDDAKEKVCAVEHIAVQTTQQEA